MLSRRISRMFFCAAKKQVVPPAPKFLSGQLQPFRFQYQNAQLYDGYSFDQLYGVKVGIKNPPAVRAQMMKDNIAAGLIVVLGLGLILHINNLFKKQVQVIKKVRSSKVTKTVQLPEPKLRHTVFQK